jgi:hypothetical protein
MNSDEMTVPPERADAEGDAKTTPLLSDEEAARLLIGFSNALDEISELLPVANDLHRRLIALQSTLTEPVVDLERILRDGSDAPSPR